MLVLNAGSSSLKFTVFTHLTSDGGQVEASGQIEGIGSSARFEAHDGKGAAIAHQQLADSVVDGRSALESLAKWLRSHFGGMHPLGVGHRVVHGGARYTTPTIVTPQVLEDLHELEPLAPLHQPHNLAAIEAMCAR